MQTFALSAMVATTFLAGFRTANQRAVSRILMGDINVCTKVGTGSGRKLF